MSTGGSESIVNPHSLRRMLAKQALESGRVPLRPADRVSDRSDGDTTCAVCLLPLSPEALGYELQFAQNGGSPATHFMHVPCFAAWESQLRANESATHSGPHDEKSTGNRHLNGHNREPAR
jgi:hypothetical protein